MTRASDLHSKAMERANLAFIARMRGDEAQAQTLFAQAFDDEVAGIAALEERERVEPWLSVLHRSAATLALDCDLPREAEKIAANALAQDPHPAVADELRDVLEQAIARLRTPIAASA